VIKTVICPFEIAGAGGCGNSCFVSGHDFTGCGKMSFRLGFKFPLGLAARFFVGFK
jgi:hypothetical protein